MTASAALAVPSTAAPRPIRVMIVDDAVVVRGLLSRWLVEAGDIEVVAVLRTGAEALASIERLRPDIVVLDVEMPDMDGVTALPQLLRRWPSATVIVSSAVMPRHAKIFLRCLDLGATDCIAKPSTNRDVTISTDFHREILDKIRTLGRRNLRGRGIVWSGDAPNAGLRRADDCALRPLVRAIPRVLAVGASTGGPNAVIEMLRRCGPALERFPVIVTQHMPKMFTSFFADHLRRQLPVDVSEAVAGDVVRPGRVLVAPGGRHLRLIRDGSAVLTVLDDGPPVNFCRPSVDVTFQSVAEIYGSASLAVVLTGMGSDGLAGATAIVESGGNVFAQDEASSVVWGMPGVVAKRGLCSAIEPVDQLARLIKSCVGVTA